MFGIVLIETTSDKHSEHLLYVHWDGMLVIWIAQYDATFLILYSVSSVRFSHSVKCSCSVLFVDGASNLVMMLPDVLLLGCVLITRAVIMAVWNRLNRMKLGTSRHQYCLFGNFTQKVVLWVPTFLCISCWLLSHTGRIRYVFLYPLLLLLPATASTLPVTVSHSLLPSPFLFFQ